MRFLKKKKKKNCTPLYTTKKKYLFFHVFKLLFVSRKILDLQRHYNLLTYVDV
jgi:hypothetical protein